MEDPSGLDNSFESEFREECKTRKDTDKKVREAIKTLERELRDESVSRKTAERQIVILYDTIEALCTRLTNLEKRVEELESGCDDPNCKYYKKTSSHSKKDDKDDDADSTKETTKDSSTGKRRNHFLRKTIAMLSPPASPANNDTSPKSSRKSSPVKEGEEGREEPKIEKSRSFQLGRSTSQVFRLKSRSMSFKSSLKIDQPVPAAVFGSMGISDELCVRVIKDIASFLKNYVHLQPSDLFQEKTWSEQTVFLKEAVSTGNIPDFSFKYQSDPQSVAQFLVEILSASEKGILNKVGQGLSDSVEIDLGVYTGLKHYKLSLLHSLVFLLDIDPHFALFYTLDLLRAFFKIQPEASLSFFGKKFGPICMREFPEKSSVNVFSTLLANFSAILEAKEDINFVVKDGRQTVHAASLDRLFEKLLDPYYRDSLFVDTFFLTYDYFVSSQEMLQKFIDYYWLASSGYPQNWKTQLSIRVLVVIKMWIMTHETFFRKDDAFLSLLRTFVDSVTSPFPNEVAFFRYFSALAYHNVDNTEPNDDLPHCIDGATEISDDSDMSSKGSDRPNPEDRTSSALTMYDDYEDDFGLVRQDSSLLRSSSDISNVTQSSSTAPPALPSGLGPSLVRSAALSRSCSTSNIYLTKDGKLGTTQPQNKFRAAGAEGLKSGSSTNIFSNLTRSASPTSSSRTVSPIPTEDDYVLARGSSNAAINITSSCDSPTPNGAEKTEKTEKTRGGLLIAGNRKSRSRTNSDDAVLRAMVTGIDGLKPSTPSSYSPVCAIESTVVAMHMAVIDQSFLKCIPYTEWLHKSFVSTESSPHFHNMVAKFNDWGRWVSTEILRREKVNDRVTAITYFVDIIRHSVAIHNYNSAAALIGGLNHSSISRLRSTWEKVPTKVMQDFNKYMSLFDMGKNYKSYREAVKASKPPVIPYLALFPKDLIAIEEGNATKLENGLINFHKLRLLAKLVKYVSQVQQPLYVHPPGTHDPQLNEYLRNKLGGKDGLLSEREMMSMSMGIQSLTSKNV